jgi:hypothetical protein
VIAEGFEPGELLGMDERDFEEMSDAGAGEELSAQQRMERAFRERLRSVKSVTERRTLAGLARELGRLPVDAARAALETSAAIAGISLRASIEFLRAAPEAARVLGAEELRAWGEIGRRLAMGDAETGVAFFASGVEALGRVPREARALVFQVCTRQMTLSSSVATETFRRAPLLAEIITDEALLSSVFEVAAEISRRSAKHSADFLNATPRVVERLNSFDVESPGGRVGRAAAALALAFAARAGGIAADAWAAMPAALAGLSAASAVLLLERAGDFLERGGGAALHVLVAGGEILRAVPEAFAAWIDLLWTVAEHGNAALVAFVRASPPLFAALSMEAQHTRAVELAERIITVTRAVARVDGEAALACFRSSPKALRTVSIEQFEQWARKGLEPGQGVDARARRSYYALETRRSNSALHTGGVGLALEEVQHTLRLYVEGLTGRAVEIAPLAAVPEEARIGDGRTIHLPSTVAEFNDDEKDFRLYKVLAAHAVACATSIADSAATWT